MIFDVEGNGQGSIDAPEEILEPWCAKDYVVKLPCEFLGFLDLKGAAGGPQVV